ncbi:hypothetical protein AgCh_001620 [Apium graveolens]
MARLQQTQRKRVGSVPHLPDDVVAAIAAEIMAINCKFINGTPNPEVEEQQRDDVLLLIGDRIVDPIERPNAGPDDVDIEDVVLEGIVVEEDTMEDPDKNG